MSPRQRWDEQDAVEVIARRDAIEGVTCPACGAPADVEMCNVSTPSAAQFAPTYFKCSSRCWTKQPERYLDAVKGLR